MSADLAAADAGTPDRADDDDRYGYEPIGDECLRGAPDPSFDLSGRLTYTVEDGDRVAAQPADALVVASLVGIDDADQALHRPVIDIDVPIRLVPSTTPGHHHLYIDHDVPYHRYLNILDALADAGIVEPGYVAATRRRGMSFVRLPWVAKVDGGGESG